MESDLLKEVQAATTEVSEQASTATQEVLDGLEGEVTQAFGSPHISSPLPASPEPADIPAKQLDFGASAIPGTPASPSTPGLPVPGSTKGATPAPGVPATPATPVTPHVYAAASEDEEVDYDKFIRDTLLWTNKVRSAVYLVGGLTLVFLTHRLVTSGTTLVTAACWALLWLGALNFLRGFVAPKLQERCTWHDSAWTAGFVSRVSVTTFGAATLVDKHLSGKEPARMLRVVLGLWGISLAGRVANVTGLAATLWVLAFTLPKAYTFKKAQIDDVLGRVGGQVKTRFLALDPKARAALIVVPIFVAGYALSTADLGIALLALALYGRSLLKPAQVEKLNSVVGAPFTNTVNKVGGTVSALVVSTANRYELTPTPLKVKRA